MRLFWGGSMTVQRRSCDGCRARSQPKPFEPKVGFAKAQFSPVPPRPQQLELGTWSSYSYMLL
jgi:hypothetical protein